jgi:hypothetical protein
LVAARFEQQRLWQVELALVLQVMSEPGCLNLLSKVSASGAMEILCPETLGIGPSMSDALTHRLEDGTIDRSI